MDFPNERELGAWFLACIEPQLLQRGCFSYCSECQHFKTGRCYGGCLAWHECDVDIEAESTSFSLAMKMGEAVDAGKPELALDQYERADYWSKSAMPTFTASVADSWLGNWEQVFRYAAYAQDMTPDPALKGHIRDLMKSIPQGDIRTAACPLPEKDSLPFVSCPSQAEGEVNERRA